MLTGNSLFQTAGNSMAQEAKDELDTFEEPGDLEDYMYDVDIARRVE